MLTYIRESGVAKKSSKLLLTSQSDAEKREEQMGNMAVLHDKAKAVWNNWKRWVTLL